MTDTTETDQIIRLMRWAYLSGRDRSLSFNEWMTAPLQSDVRQEIERVAGQMVSEMM